MSDQFNKEVPLGGANIINTPYTNLPLQHRIEGLSDEDLEKCLKAVQDEIKFRQTRKAEELIDKVSLMLNDLRELGVDLVIEDEFGDECNVTECVESFGRNHFRARGIRV